MVTENQQSSTKWDFLRDSIADNMDVSLISPAIVQQTLWNGYLKKENVQENWQTKEKIVVDEVKFKEDDRLTLAHAHLKNMKSHLEKYNENNLADFYTNIHSTEDIALCITASLYVDKDDVIEWVKAKVFLPENYWLVRMDWSVEENWWRENLDASEYSDKQRVSEQWIYDKAVDYGVTDKRQIAYILSTIKWESSFKNQKEIWWENRDYWKVDSETKQAYYGRWFIQLTHKHNYEKYTQIIKDMWKDFKDNDGNIIKSSEIDLVNNPDIILTSNELAIFIAIHWMKNWIFTWKKLDDYINDNETNYVAARAVVNGSDKADSFASNAQAYYSKLDGSETSMA